MNSATNSFRSDTKQKRVLLARKARTRMRTLPAQPLATAAAQAGKPLKPDAASLKEAIRLAQQGDAAAFETIYQLHSRRVYALCLRMTGDPVEAEDLTQEAFLQLFRKIHTFRGESAFSSWMHRLTANIVLMRFRQKRPVPVPPERNDSPRRRKGPPRLRNRRPRPPPDRPLRSHQPPRCCRAIT